MNRVSIGGIGSGPISQRRRRRFQALASARLARLGCRFPCKTGTILHNCKDNWTPHQHRTHRDAGQHARCCAARAASGRQTTLAPEIAERRPSIYLDLESDADRARLAQPELYLAEHQDKLVILDEVHRLPNLFQKLRGLIDRGRRGGRKAGRFLPKSNAWHPTKLPLRGGQRLFVLSSRTGKERQELPFPALLQT
ncbi:AAA family ATPase [Mesorhizobium sp. M0984]|uniref:AAA family ATPase n=1 Tax=Mesorhizobium sp. M0984 TaxID=2957041 RepID=UPI00333C3C23